MTRPAEKANPRRQPGERVRNLTDKANLRTRKCRLRAADLFRDKKDDYPIAIGGESSNELR